MGVFLFSYVNLQVFFVREYNKPNVFLLVFIYLKFLEEKKCYSVQWIFGFSFFDVECGSMRVCCMAKLMP
jgi:hypothetical protein